MKHLLLTTLLTGIYFLADCQTIQLGQDTNLCNSTQIGITSNLTATNINAMTNPTNVVLTDDVYSALIPIGFSFVFYGNTYTDLVIGSNGVVSFDPSLANGFCPWSITTGIPTSTFHSNSILMPFMDMNPASGGQVMYEMTGTAPNRKFIVFFKGVFLYSCTTSCWSAATVLHEGTNEIEAFLNNKPLCSSWNSGYSIEGIQNAGGTIAHPVPGRNYPDLWTTGADGQSWTPTGPNSYTISPIPYKLTIDANNSLLWASTDGQTYAFTDTIQASVSGSQTLGYYLIADSSQICDYNLFVSDTSWISGGDSLSYETGNDFCNAGIGYFNSTVAGSTDNMFYWPVQGVFSDTMSLTQGTYPFVFYSISGCTIYDTLNIVNSNTFNVVVDSASCGNSDGGITILPDLPYFTYNWINPSGSSGNQVTNLPIGTYSCYVQSSIGCSDTLVFAIGSDDLNVSVVSTTQEVNGNDGSVQLAAIGGTPPYLFSIGGFFQSGTMFNGVAGGTYTGVVMDNNGCTDSVVFVITSQVGLSEMFKDVYIIYPNPVKTDLHIEFQGNELFKVSIFDLAGKCLVDVEGKNAIGIDLNQLSSGMYNLVISDDFNTWSEKIVKLE